MQLARFCKIRILEHPNVIRYGGKNLKAVQKTIKPVFKRIVGKGWKI